MSLAFQQGDGLEQGEAIDSTPPMCFAPPDRSGLPLRLERAVAAIRVESDNGLLAASACDIRAGLGDKSLQALARLIPTLACGEESAVHVFYSEADRLAQLSDSVQGSQLLLYRIAKEEEMHDALLKRGLSILPVPDDMDQIRLKAKRFYINVASRDPALHFFRISELDSAVCIMMSCLLERTCEVSRAPFFQKVVERIRSDEAGHVYASREHVRLLGLDVGTRLDDAEQLRVRLIKMLENVADSIDALGVDPAGMFRRILNRKTLCLFES